MSFSPFRDCIKGVGWNVLKQAYEILGRIEEDEVEVRDSYFYSKCPKFFNTLFQKKFFF